MGREERDERGEGRGEGEKGGWARGKAMNHSQDRTDRTRTEEWRAQPQRMMHRQRYVSRAVSVAWLG
jgi:hypothetical protein